MEANLDTRNLSPTEAESIMSALDRVDLERVEGARDWPPGAADTFRYTLEVHRGDSTRTANFSERQLPDELALVVHALMERARPRSRKG